MDLDAEKQAWPFQGRDAPWCYGPPRCTLGTMRRPDLNRMMEAYFPLAAATAPDPWLRYASTLRDVLAPLIRGLLRERIITWYCFLLHECPTAPGEYCIHLRVCPTKHTTDEVLRQRLHGADPIRPAGSVAVLTGVDASPLGRGVPEAWQLLGTCSALSLELVEAHPGAAAMQFRGNVAQYLHFLCNQLQGEMLGVCVRTTQP